ncbi:Fe2+-dependent dioxygenase [Qipengyuania sp. ASV99]|uniref:Fe2+-dependent dioxygenase n=1 Tax=Qipengyuania sp. ASV99 TaxID=3399681 RepID=UPI003A4C6871
MFRLIENVLSSQQLSELKRIADQASYVDGRISNPHNKAKKNLHMHDERLQQQAVQIMANALLGNEDFVNFAVPAQFAPPLITRYEPGMRYGLHPDSALMTIGNVTIRSDLSCTIFLGDPASYDGGALRIQLGTEEVRIKGPAGSAIVYPSHTLHEVEEVLSGQRLVGLTFIQSQIADTFHRELLYELNEVAALEGLNMSHENFTKLQAVQFNLKRLWTRS